MTDAYSARPLSRVCDGCGDALASESRFCGGCGAPAPAEPAPATDSEVTTVLSLVDLVPDTRPAGSAISEPVPAAAANTPVTGRRHPRARVVASLALGLIVVGVLVADDVRQRGSLDRTRSRLAATQRTLAETTAKLDATVADLAATETELTATKGKLTASEKTVATLRQQLTGVRNSLSDAKGKVEVQATQIVTLKTCLDGVSLALTDVAYGDYASAITALDAVRVSCEAASRIVA